MKIVPVSKKPTRLDISEPAPSANRSDFMRVIQIPDPDSN